MKIFYVYAYLRKDGTPYYIGKGKNNRVYEKHHVGVPGDKSFVKFLYTDLSEKQALAYEVFWIAVYGRKNNNTGILRNLTDGGDGISGFKHTPQSLKKISAAGRGNQHAKGKNIGNQNAKGGKSRTGMSHPIKSLERMAQTKTRFRYYTPKGIMETKREMILAFPEFTTAQLERFTRYTLLGFSRKLKVIFETV